MKETAIIRKKEKIIKEMAIIGKKEKKIMKGISIIRKKIMKRKAIIRKKEIMKQTSIIRKRLRRLTSPSCAKDTSKETVSANADSATIKRPKAPYFVSTCSNTTG